MLDVSDLADDVVPESFKCPISRELMRDPTELDQVLSTGREKAETVANATLERVRDALGFARPA